MHLKHELQHRSRNASERRLASGKARTNKRGARHILVLVRVVVVVVVVVVVFVVVVVVVVVAGFLEDSRDASYR